MSATSTIYDIKLQYGLDDRASLGLKNLGDQADRAATHSMSLWDGLKRVAAIVGVGAAIHKGKEVFIDFNSEMEKLRISLGAVLQMNLGGTFEDAQASAKGLFNEFQNFAKVTPLTTKEIVEFGNNISAAVFTAGGSMKDFVQLTEQGAIAAQVLGGVSSEFAGIEMQHLLAGDISTRMRFINQLMAPTLARHKMDHHAFKALDQAGRMGLIKEALNDPGLKAAAKGFEKSFAGVASTFADNLQIQLGKVGLPLFKTITKEIEKWNQWIEKNAETIENFTAKFSKSLVDGFEAIKKGVNFLIDHRQLITAIAGAWGVSKLGGGMYSSLLGGPRSAAGGFKQADFGQIIAGAGMGLMYGMMGQKLGGPLDAVEAAGTAAAGALSRIPGLVGMISQTILGLKAALDFFLDEDIKQKKATAEAMNLAQQTAQDLNRIKTGGGDRDQIDNYMMLRESAGLFITRAKEWGAVTDDFKANVGVIKAKLEETNFSDTDKRAILARMVSAIEENVDLVEKKMGGKKGLQEDTGRMGKRGDTNITIQRIEVASDDPDRFAFKFVDAFENITRNPTAARTALRGG